ncbi:MAG: DUF1471 domain-containing protein [Nanoarchaeota archaeon]
MEPKTTKRYMAEYTIRSCIIDGGCFMPDPEPHQERRNFEAADDAEAKKKAEEYYPEIAKNYWGSSITLESVSEVREVELQKPELMSLEARVRKVRFDEKLNALVDERGQKYTGKKFRGVSAWSSLGGFSSRENACHDALEKIETLAQKAGADAYEITSKDVHDTQQEYDPKPYTICVSAILYRRG